MFNRETNKSRGFGFVVFESENSVEHVLQNRNHTIDSKSVEVKKAVPRTDAPPSRNSSTRGSFSGPSSSTSSTTPTSRSATTPAASSEGTTATTRTSDEPPRSFAAVANGTLGGYAAAVRYGGRVPQQKSTQQSNNSSGGSSSPDSGLSEAMERATLEDDSSRLKTPSESFGQEHSHADQSPPSHLDKSSPKMQMGNSANLSLGQDSSVQWSGYNPGSSQYGLGQQPQQSRLQDVNSSGQSAFQWHQQPQWQQWSHGRGLGQENSADQSQAPNVPPQQQQSGFFSMFGPSIGGSGIGQHADSAAAANTDAYRPGTWDSSSYGGGLGMSGMMGSGMGGMGIGMGGGMGLPGMGNLMQGQPQRNAFASPSLGGGGEGSMPYGSSFGSGGLGSLNHDPYRRGENLEGAGMGMGGGFGSGLGGGDAGVNSEGTAEQQQQQSLDSMGLDYGSYQNPNTSSQFQGYR